MGLDWWALLGRPACMLAVFLLVLYDLSREKKPKKKKEARHMTILFNWLMDGGERRAYRRRQRALRKQAKAERKAAKDLPVGKVTDIAEKCRLDAGPVEVHWT